MVKQVDRPVVGGSYGATYLSVTPPTSSRSKQSSSDVSPGQTGQEASYQWLSGCFHFTEDYVEGMSWRVMIMSRFVSDLCFCFIAGTHFNAKEKGTFVRFH
jgi:hypothetical protein